MHKLAIVSVEWAFKGEPGHGATFVMRLPVIARREDRPATSAG